MEKKSIFRSAFLSLRVLIALLLCAPACFIAVGTVPAFLRPEERAKVSERTLIFAERVAYQYAVEEVYWRHRIWPEENPESEPTLDAIVSRYQIQRKVADYLRKSQLIADKRGSPITATELQAEMDRMASHTKQADTLRELFAALGSDPFVIAECLAKPVLVGRSISELNMHDESFQQSVDLTRVAVAPMIRAASSVSNVTYSLPQIEADCSDDSWTPTSTAGVPDVRFYHTAVWTGSEMIVWGGFNSSPPYRLNTGSRYSPATDSWTATSLVDAPVPRTLHAAVWTGNEMIVWGGEGNGNPREVNTGGRYNPITDSWIATSTANAPVPREQHSAVWTGSEMIVWAGRDDTTWFNSGGRYNPDTDSWTATSTLNAPERRWYHTVEWTGSEMVVWGGTNQTIELNTGGKYNPATDSWTATSTANVPLGRFAHTAVWTGSEMIVWGGVDSTFNDTNTGGRYNPSNDSWVATSLNNAPSPRDSHTAVWTGTEMIIWAGIFNTTNLNTGGRYNGSTDSWTATSIVNALSARYDHTAVWTGTEMIAWGGLHYPSPFLNTGGIYCAQAATPIVQSAVSRKAHGNAGSFGVNLPLSGTSGIECRSGGATSDYTIVLTFLANVSVNGNPQAAVSSGIGTIGSGGVSNGGMVITSGNVVTIPLTNVANAQAINVTLNDVNGSTNVTIPMRVLIGDVNGNGAVNASDVAQTKSRSGQPVAAATFRSDVNANGMINATDVSLVKSSSGTGLP